MLALSSERADLKTPMQMTQLFFFKPGTVTTACIQSFRRPAKEDHKFKVK